MKSTDWGRGILINFITYICGKPLVFGDLSTLDRVRHSEVVYILSSYDICSVGFGWFREPPPIPCKLCQKYVLRARGPSVPSLRNGLKGDGLFFL